MFTEIINPDQMIWQELARELQKELNKITEKSLSGSIFVRYHGDPRKHLVKRGNV